MQRTGVPLLGCVNVNNGTGLSRKILFLCNTTHGVSKVDEAGFPGSAKAVLASVYNF